jgi:hypothetical protein
VAPTRVKPGPKPKDDWPTWVARWLVMMAVEYPDELRNVDGLVEGAREFLTSKGKFAPSEDKDIRKVLMDLLSLVRR